MIPLLLWGSGFRGSKYPIMEYMGLLGIVAPTVEIFEESSPDTQPIVADEYVPAS